MSTRKNILITFCILTSTLCYPAGITNMYHHSRLGDNLVCYLHAKWLSFVHGIPMYYEPFPLAEQLVLSTQEKMLDQCPFKNKVVISKNNFHTIDATKDFLYAIPYFPEYEIELKNTKDNWFSFPVNWDNQEFYEEICSLIKPINPIVTLSLPTDRITVAVHVRKGSQGIDLPLLNETPNPYSHAQYADRVWPLKFPSPQFYIDSIKKVSELCDHAPMYVYIFTDHHNPLEIVNLFMKKLRKFPNIQLDCRRTGNQHNVNVLEDFFSMTKFDCLIHPLSNYSYVVGKISNFKIQIWPTQHHWERNKLIIDEVEIQLGRTFNHKK